MSHRDIKSYGVIGDMHSAALVGHDGAIDWLCFPRFDCPSVFAGLLDHDAGGIFSIAPAGDYESTQSYQPDSNILVTTFRTAEGSFALIDFMPVAVDVTASDHEVVRLVRGIEGRVPVRLVFQPRLDYARGRTDLALAGERMVTARKDAAELALSSSVPLTLDAENAIASAEFAVAEGEDIPFLLRWDPPAEGMPAMDQYDVYETLGRTEAFWRFVVQDWRYLGRWENVIKRSMLALHLLIYAPTGAVTAAVTTSLPGEIGGVRNWDYRFCWLRDAAFTMDIFNRLGHTAYSRPFISWLASLALNHEDAIRPFYPITHDPDSQMTEIVLPHLTGFKGSRPVRIGNAAFDQFQLDIYGEVLLSFDSYQRAGGIIDDSLWVLTELLVERAIREWRLPDSGIWEMRSEPKHFVFSKLMAWVAVDRGLRLARALQKPVDFDRWRQARAEIRQDIMEHGWNAKKESFVQHYGATNMDSCLLFIPLVGFLPGDDPRMVSTIDRIKRELMTGGFLRRYDTGKTDDGVGGSEGVFTLCTLWLAGALIIGGQLEEGQRVFERVIGVSNHLGLYSEMIDPPTGDFLSNYPQALTHIGIIHTARNLDRALNKAESGKVVAA